MACEFTLLENGDLEVAISGDEDRTFRLPIADTLPLLRFLLAHELTIEAILATSLTDGSDGYWYFSPPVKPAPMLTA